MGKRFTVLLLLAFSCRAAAEEAVNGENGVPTASITAAAVPAMGTAISFLPLVFPETAGLAPWIGYPILLGAHIPMYWIDAGRGLAYTAAGLLLPAAGVPLMFASASLPVARPFSQSLLGAYSNLMKYAAYDVYRLERPDRKGYGLETLTAAPFQWEQVSDPLVWAASLAAPAILTGYYLFGEPDLGRPVYETGKAFVGSLEVTPLVGGLAALGFGAFDMLAVSIGEEAYYRGILYEETKRAFGVIPARITDMLLFPLVHLPGDLQSGFKPSTVVFNFCWRSAMALLFDAAYDSGGLPRSAALHYWSDLILILSRWIFYGGGMVQSP